MGVSEFLTDAFGISIRVSSLLQVGCLRKECEDFWADVIS